MLQIWHLTKSTNTILTSCIYFRVIRSIFPSYMPMVGFFFRLTHNLLMTPYQAIDLLKITSGGCAHRSGFRLSCLNVASSLGWFILCCIHSYILLKINFALVFLLFSSSRETREIEVETKVLLV